MISQTSMANLALSHLGHGQQIANLDSDSSSQAKAVREFWDLALAEVHRDFDWPFTTKFVSLGLIEEDPIGSEWSYAYSYPADCHKFRRILSGSRSDTEDTAIPYRLAYGEAGTLILTDLEEAMAEYTVLVTDPQRYPSDFVIAFSFLLAFYIAPRITSGDPAKLGQRALGLYQMQIQKARANARNEERKDKAPDPEMIRARG